MTYGRSTPSLNDDKKLGAFGAPACRCTSLLISLCLSLSGLVVCGAGACITGFLWNDETPKALGICFVILGLLMIASGFGLYVWDASLSRRRNYVADDQQLPNSAASGSQISPGRVVNSVSGGAGSSNLQGSATDGRISTISGNFSGPSRASTSRAPEAPPTYDESIISPVSDDAIQYRSNNSNCKQQNVRPSYNYAVQADRYDDKTSTTQV